jgi:ankyrin repeat protein
MKNGSIDIIFILLDYGADLNIKNNKRVTPLYFGTKKMLKLLGLSDGTTSILNDESTIDNNSLYFRPTVDEIYPDHFY